MEWTTVLATLLGAAIATGTSLMVEMRKDRRAIAAEWRRTRRDLYASFLTAMTQARSDLRALAVNANLTAPQRVEAARKAFAGCYELRHQLELFAPTEVVETALVYFRCVRGLRDAVAAGLSDPEWQRHGEQVKLTLAAVHQAMKADLRPA